MKEIDEKKLQEMLEQGLSLPDAALSAGEEQELEHYTALWEVLEQPVVPDLSIRFAANVSARIRLEKGRKTEVRFNLLIAAVCLLLGGGAVSALVFFSGNSPVMQLLSHYGPILPVGLALILLIQYLDQKLVKEKVRSYS
ncbi:hypothetical protein [Chitinophaga pinensis]|uniref:Uncharacterized protein n=1 Tax=Chitinophaga pinensis (strain ATCC 43595 / DSM 2588 / LMG 13176 / NBRC 15968 / NCIMB 11800 / UQM 2034) TaxID=485918 RepID=A0A979GTV5_CHIPD|nr:hypothetical protein [Chitinophaga pinensis]ACU60111.1 hypothetical protein Cpin_2629 [Chitinophaga pinensis DSM 2588]